MILHDFPSTRVVTASIYADDIPLYVTADTVPSGQALLQDANYMFAKCVDQWGLVVNS